jgi:hypothetical protein
MTDEAFGVIPARLAQDNIEGTQLFERRGDRLRGQSIKELRPSQSPQLLATASRSAGWQGDKPLLGKLGQKQPR